jgi:hypothetical protein
MSELRYRGEEQSARDLPATADAVESSPLLVADHSGRRSFEFRGSENRSRVVAGYVDGVTQEYRGDF